MSIPSPLLGNLDAPEIIRAFKGNGRQALVCCVQLLLLRDQIKAALELKGRGSVARRKYILESIRPDLKTIALGMVLGKKKLRKRALAAYKAVKDL